MAELVERDGRVVMFAEVADAGVAVTRKTGSSGGNKSHDARSGRFAPGGGRKRKGATPPANVDPLEFSRMLDAVRDAARELDVPGEEEVRDFLQGRAANPDQVDLKAFLARVQEQRLADVVDLLDQQFRGRGSKNTKVKLSASRGFLKNALAGLDSNQVAQAMHRLEARGHDRDKIDKFFGKNRDDADDAKTKRDGIAASDWSAMEVPAPAELVMQDDSDAMEFAERIIKSMPAPVFNIEVPVTVEGQGKKTIKRDPTTGLITEIE